MERTKPGWLLVGRGINECRRVDYVCGARKLPDRDRNRHHHRGQSSTRRRNVQLRHCKSRFRFSADEHPVEHRFRASGVELPRLANRPAHEHWHRGLQNGLFHHQFRPFLGSGERVRRRSAQVVLQFANSIVDDDGRHSDGDGNDHGQQLLQPARDSADRNGRCFACSHRCDHLR